MEKHLKSLIIDEPQVFFPANDGWQDGLVLVSSLTYAIYQTLIATPTIESWIPEDEDEIISE